MAASQVLISADPYETRVAVLENEELVELSIQPSGQERSVGNIYKGQVSSVIPGLEAAFVDIGIGRNAFLHVQDYLPDSRRRWDRDRIAGNGEEEEENGISDEEFKDLAEEFPPTPPDIRIADYLTEGQSVLVQMEKEPLGQKGCRVTAHISLPGRYLVFFPTENHVAISRRIQNEGERERLTGIGQRLVGDRYGIILRTVSEGVAEEELSDEFAALEKRWLGILDTSEAAGSPGLIYKGVELLHQVVRDLVTSATQEILIEGEDAHARVREYVEDFLPGFGHRVHLYKDPIPLFRAKGIDAEIERLLQRRVWMKSGGYLVLDETEALTVVDVNTGRDLGRSNLEETAFATNVEACKEIARQLRLRDIGGIIVIDFIDMMSPTNQRAVMEQFEQAMSRDRSHPSLFSMTELGLVQLTRKRVRKSLLKDLSRHCPYCKGEGIVFSEATMVTRILRRLEELLMEDPRDKIVLYVHPTLAQSVNADWSERIEELSQKHETKLKVVAEPGLHFQDIREAFEE
jgi:ribonuclease G